MIKNKYHRFSLLLNIHPLQRIAISIVFAGIVWFFIREINETALFKIICIWCAFALSFLLLAWLVLFSRDVSHIKKIALKEDVSRSVIVVLTTISSLAAMFTVLLLIISSSKNVGEVYERVAIGFLSVVLSWILVHTIFTFHYAHLYYENDKNGKKQNREGLVFPNDTAPNYFDFAYFSFIIGMTFQVSDVQITDKKIRRLVLLHSLISFVLNTFVVAITVNFIAGLSK